MTSIRVFEPREQIAPVELKQRELGQREQQLQKKVIPLKYGQ
jgi:hypothetical protein